MIGGSAGAAERVAGVTSLREVRRIVRRAGVSAAAVLAALAGASVIGGRARAGASSDAAQATVTFRDVTRASGIRFTYQYDLSNAKMLATQGGGAAFADYDGDGRLDLYTVGSVASYKASLKPGGSKSCGKLWHNEGPGPDGVPRFRDATPESGIVACGWGQGAYWVDTDGDGDSDLFLTNAGRNQLYVNEGREAAPRFADRSDASGLGAAEGFHVGAGFFDADRDGDVDVYVADYLVTDIDYERKLSGINLKTPDDYEAAPNHLYVNDGRGVFTERTDEAGLADPGGKSLGVAPYDYDGDGWTDLYIANDRTPNALFRNNRDGTFTDVAVENNCAFDENGAALSGMGLAVGDFDRDGLPDIFVTNFAPEWNTFYHALGGGRFEDATGRSGLGPPSADPVSWGTGAVDYDNDGRLDLYVANGNIVPFWLIKIAKLLSHEKERAAKYLVGKSYRQTPQLFRGRGDGTFEDVTAASGDLAKLRLVSRGSAAGDVDGDGDLDLFFMDTTGFPFGKRDSPLLLNEGGNRRHAIAFHLVAGADRRTVLGAKVVVESTGERLAQEWEIQPSFASGSDTPLWFGTGERGMVDRVTVTWPDGKTEVHERLDAVGVWRLSPQAPPRLESRFTGSRTTR
jgi:hypothetical protein